MGDKPVEGEAKAEPKVEASGDAYAEFLASIKTKEGTQKYKTIPEALIGASHQEMHIARLEEENKELRGVSEKVSKLEELIARLSGEKPADKPVVTKPEDTEKVVLGLLERREQEARERENRYSVLTTLRDKFGDKAEEVLATKAKDLGLSLSDLGNLAARSPKAVLGYFQVEIRGTPTVNSTVNIGALQPKPQTLDAPKNLLWGAPTKDVIGFLRQCKDEVQKELGLG
jgi:hypothetical protein